MQPRHIHELPRGTVGFSWIEFNLALEADHLLDRLGQLLDRHVGADPDIHHRRQEDPRLGFVTPQQGIEGLVRQVHQIDASVGHVVADHEFPPRGAGAPDADARGF